MSKLCFYITFIFSVLVSNTIYAQPNTGEFINISAGIGICAPNDESEIDGNGFYAQAEYIWCPLSWFGVRPYAGVIAASGEIGQEGQIMNYRIKSNAALLGAKIRLAAPIPYFAPFIEVGAGMSVGSFETFTEYTSTQKNGVLLHIPFAFGVALGRKHNFEIKFTYYEHPSVSQFSGAAAIGFTFPIDN